MYVFFLSSYIVNENLMKFVNIGNEFVFKEYIFREINTCSLTIVKFFVEIFPLDSVDNTIRQIEVNLLTGLMDMDQDTVYSHSSDTHYNVPS